MVVYLRMMPKHGKHFAAACVTTALAMCTSAAEAVGHPVGGPRRLAEEDTAIGMVLAGAVVLARGTFCCCSM